jgi:hypothetical protein
VRVGDLGTVLVEAGRDPYQAVYVGGARLAVEEDDDVCSQGVLAPPEPVGLVTCVPAGDQPKSVHHFTAQSVRLERVGPLLSDLSLSRCGRITLVLFGIRSW